MNVYRRSRKAKVEESGRIYQTSGNEETGRYDRLAEGKYIGRCWSVVEARHGPAYTVVPRAQMSHVDEICWDPEAN